MKVLIKRYKNTIEEIIIINELREWIKKLYDEEIGYIIMEIDKYYKIEMNWDE